MPTYDYICQTCDHTFEELQSMTAAPLSKCPSCNKDALKRKIGGGIGLSFVGTGFYCTDYKDALQESKASSCCPCGKNTACTKSS